jgi:hypothetical protein
VCTFTALEPSEFDVYSYCRLNDQSSMCTVTVGWTIRVRCVQLLQAERSEFDVYSTAGWTIRVRCVQYCRLYDQSSMCTVTVGWTIRVRCVQYCRLNDQISYPKGDSFPSPCFVGRFWVSPSLLSKVTLKVSWPKCLCSSKTKSTAFSQHARRSGYGWHFATTSPRRWHGITLTQTHTILASVI